MSDSKTNQLEEIGRGIIAPTPTISITDAVLFNTCLIATADSDDVRYYLSYLLIDPIKKTITGCNGHFIVTGEALDFSNWKSNGKLLILPAKKLPKEVFYATINIKERIITGTAKKGTFTIPFTMIDKKYPSFAHIIANEENKISTENICLNPKFLGKRAKSIILHVYQNCRASTKNW